MELIDKFLEFEDENSLLKKSWGYIRFELLREIESKNNGTASFETNIQKPQGNRFIRRLKQSLTAYRRSPMRRRETCNILFLNHERRMLLDGKDTPIYFYALIEELTGSYALLEPWNIYGGHYGSERFSENTYYLDGFCAAAKIYRALHIYRKIDTIFSVEFIKILDSLEAEFNIKLDKDSWIKKIWILKSGYTVGKKYFSKMLKKLKPKCILEVVHYNYLFMMINEAAHELGIPVFELQHGVMGYHHIAYNYLKKCRYPNLPDKMLLYSDFWKAETRFPLDNKNVIAVGYPHMERMVKKYSPVTKEENCIVFLFISQWTISKSLSRFAVDVAEALEVKGINYKIIYKLHPGEVLNWSQNFPWLMESKHNIEVIDNAERNIYEFYSIANVQVGVYSTGLYEGLAFNLKTFIFKAPGSEGMKSLYENGYARLVTDPAELLKNLYCDEKKDGEFWKRNSVSNILKVIDSELSINE